MGHFNIVLLLFLPVHMYLFYPMHFTSFTQAPSRITRILAEYTTFLSSCRYGFCILGCCHQPAALQ